MRYSNDISLAQFGPADVVRGTTISSAHLRNWVSRGKDDPVVPLTAVDKSPSVPGHATLFSYRRMLQIGIMVWLTRYGIGAREASFAALRFTDTSDGFNADGVLTDERDLAHHWPAGDSYMFVTKEGNALLHNVLPETPLNLIYARVKRIARPAELGFVVLNITEIDEHIRLRVGRNFEREVPRSSPPVKEAER